MSTKTAEKNQRRFSRIPFEASVTLNSPKGKWTGKLLDISLNGVLITRPLSWLENNENRVMLEIHPPGEQFNIRMEVEAVHVEKECVGLRCVHIDLDSVSHLRRLIELNIGDDDILQRELTELIKN
ncbi:MAG: PilZ domain-containing protein [Gammaproteobacteria bacterium]|nr:PilZ domain-containing protein [Gammaproteobacteria bacterium]